MKLPLAKIDCETGSFPLGTTNDQPAVENERASDDKDFVPWWKKKRKKKGLGLEKKYSWWSRVT